MSATKYLGRRVKDKVTGLEGVITGYVLYLTGCNQCLVCPASRDGKPSDSAWYDEQRLEFVDDSRIVLDNEKSPGFDLAPPRR